jgi:inner membrane transporter RhtA
MSTLYALFSMLSVQVGLAASVHLIDDLGTAGTAWLRLSWAGLLAVLLFRPRRSSFTRRTLLMAALLGVNTAAITILFTSAIARLPLGTASALEFLGPLAVTLLRGRKLYGLLAFGGVLLLTSPWEGSLDPVGIGFALGAAACWAAYILLTQRLGDQVEGFGGLAVSLAFAALTATVVAGPATLGRLTPTLVAYGLGLAVILPLLPFALEYLALRRLTTGTFGTLMALEPATALVIGLVVLHQLPTWPAVLGVALVVTAGVGAARSAPRDLVVAGDPSHLDLGPAGDRDPLGPLDRVRQ